MRYAVIVFLLFFIGTYSGAQRLLTPPAAYYSHLWTADSLCELGKYKEAAVHVSQAFAAFDGRATPDDRYKALRIFAIANEFDSAFRHIEMLADQQFTNHLRVTRDTALFALRKSDTARFEKTMNRFRLNYEKFTPAQNLEWTTYLDSLFLDDQVIRKKYQRVGNEQGWKSPGATALMATMSKKDSMNTIAIAGFIDKHGWPGPDVVGQRGNSTLFLIIQHADAAIQEKYLPVMQKAVQLKHANAADLAFLEDRVSIARHGYQLYGTQVHFDQVKNKMAFFPIKDERNVDERRKKMGLSPLTEYAELFNISYIMGE
jgi:hypothetical protein